MSLIIAAGSAFLPALMFMGYAVDPGRDIKWGSYVRTTEMVLFFLLSIVMFSVITAYVYIREYSDKTAGMLYAYPTSKWSVFLGKLTVVYLIILFVYGMNYLLTMGSGYIVCRGLPEPGFFADHARISLYSATLQFLLMPVVVLIANLSRTVLIPIVYSSLGAVSNIIVMQSDHFKYSLFMIPGMPLIQYMGEAVDAKTMLFIGTAAFVLGITGNVFYYIKADMQ